VRALALPDVRGKIADLAMEVVGNSPDKFAADIRSGSCVLCHATIPLTALFAWREIAFGAILSSRMDGRFHIADCFDRGP